jgi:hydrogenase maturation protease
MRPLILFIGNYIYRDDKIPLLIGEKAKDILYNLGFDVEIVERTGYSLIDYVVGRETVFIVDTIKTDKYPVGTVVNIDIDDISSFRTVSPHYAGLPEMIELMDRLDVDSPKKLFILGIEVDDPYTLDDNISSSMRPLMDSITRNMINMIMRLYEDHKT